MSEQVISTADMWDRHGKQLQVSSLDFRVYGGLASFEGVAVTVCCYENNFLVRETIMEPGRGRVLVVDGRSSIRCALAGDQIAAAAAKQGWEGIVVNGAIRDVAGLAKIPIGVMALRSSPRSPSATGGGERDVPVVFGDVLFRPGDLVVGDNDGIAVLAG